MIILTEAPRIITISSPLNSYISWTRIMSIGLRQFFISICIIENVVDILVLHVRLLSLGPHSSLRPVKLAEHHGRWDWFTGENRVNTQLLLGLFKCYANIFQCLFYLLDNLLHLSRLHVGGHHSGGRKWRKHGTMRRLPREVRKSAWLDLMV